MDALSRWIYIVSNGVVQSGNPMAKRKKAHKVKHRKHKHKHKRRRKVARAGRFGTIPGRTPCRTSDGRFAVGKKGKPCRVP